MDRQVYGEEAEYGFRAWLFGGRYLGLVLVDGCARVRVGRTRSVPLRYGSSGLRALFRVRRAGGEEVGYVTLTGSYASEPQVRPRWYNRHPEHQPIDLHIPELQPTAPASNRLPNGAVYNAR